MKHIKKHLTALLTISIIAFVMYRMFADPQIRWQEEVKLHDGRVVVVDRWEKRLAGGLGGRGLPLWSEVKAKNPNTGTEVIWYEDAGSAPYVLDFIGDVAYVAAWVSFYHPCKKYGFPKRDFVFFKYDKTWQQISFEEFPQPFDTNLLFDAWTADSRGHLRKHTTLVQKAEYLRSEYKLNDYSMRHLINNPAAGKSACGEFGQSTGL